MAGYSGTPLPKKLGIKPGLRIALLGAPPKFEEGTLGPLPVEVKVSRSLTGKAPFDVVVLFVTASSNARAEGGLQPIHDLAGTPGFVVCFTIQKAKSGGCAPQRY